jgi:hypothetical protein
MTISWLKHVSVKSGRLLCFRGVRVATGGVKLSPWRSQELRGSPELQKGGLRALEEAWMTISGLRRFSVKSGLFLSRASPGSSRRSRALSEELPGS